jgi:methionyl-tRNA formyltransferase
MSSYFSKKEYTLVRFEKSKQKNKKYSAILENKSTKKTKRINFGDTRYQNYRDITGLNLYPQLVHNDKSRRQKYIARHSSKVREGYYSAGYFALKYLW